MFESNSSFSFVVNDITNTTDVCGEHDTIGLVFSEFFWYSLDFYVFISLKDKNSTSCRILCNHLPYSVVKSIKKQNNEPLKCMHYSGYYSTVYKNDLITMHKKIVKTTRFESDNLM